MNLVHSSYEKCFDLPNSQHDELDRIGLRIKKLLVVIETISRSITCPPNRFVRYERIPSRFEGRQNEQTTDEYL
jgi:hypothetical protein